MTIALLALAAGATALAWHDSRVTAQHAGPADSYMEWMLRHTDRQGYRSF